MYIDLDFISIYIYIFFFFFFYIRYYILYCNRKFNARSYSERALVLLDDNVVKLIIVIVVVNLGGKNLDEVP